MDADAIWSQIGLREPEHSLLRENVQCKPPTSRRDVEVLTGIAAWLASGFVTSLFFGDPRLCALQLRSPQGLINRNPDGVELVIARHLLDQRAAAVVLEHDEVPDHGEEAAPARRRPPTSPEAL